MEIQITNTNKIKKERTYPGRSVSKGVGFGRVLCLFGQKRQFYKSHIDAGDADNEINRFRVALKTASDELSSIVKSSESASEAGDIFETHLMFLRDRSLVDKVEKTISGEKVNCEWAVSRVIDEFVAKYKALTDKHLREKYIDLLDVGERVVAALGGGNSVEFSIEGPTVFVAREINPSTLIEIAANKPVALVTEFGGWTSHTFILARELEIPAVTGVKDLLRVTETGDGMLVDGESGMIIINPAPETVEKFKENGFSTKLTSASVSGIKSKVSTKDGFEIRLSANLDLSREPEKMESIKDFGVGLYRTEYLFRRSSDYPSESEQIERYRQVFDIADGANCRFRTFDLSVKEIVGRHGAPEKNPALGLRGIRLSLRDSSQFRTQIRALLKAGIGKNFDIVLPFVTDISEIEIASGLIADETQGLVDQGFDVVVPKIGAMVEVPSAVLMIDEILEKTAFVNIGTNDLVQYLLASDRDNDDVAENFRTLHPAVLRSLKKVLDSANSAGKEAVVCGEMAGSPLYVPLLIGLGAGSLSMNLTSMQRVARVISAISKSEAAGIAGIILNCKTADETEQKIHELYRSKWPDLDDIPKIRRAVLRD